ncbi:MAG TPA: hypothetical protein VLA93_06670 [Pyrinomonadaceae bacterium]|nr:hypothetical protein [Pyrinomonadaceae bacterium]
MERAGSSHGPSDKDELAEREREATSKETLKDVGEKEKSHKTPDESHDKPPSPDGAFDENREIEDADPF